MTATDGALARCVGDTEGFLAGAWGSRAHHHRAPGGFADLLAVNDVDHLVGSAGLRAPAFRLVKDGQTLPAERYTRAATIGSKRVTDLADVGLVYDHFAEGATIVLQGLHRYWQPLARFCRELEFSLTHPVQANAYLTPPVAQGLQFHADGHDVFALQTHGRKQWAVAADHAGDEPDAELRVDLAAGECLYVPKGTRHAARTVDTASLHITIGVRTVTWRDVERDALALAADEEDLPAGFADDENFGAAVAFRLRQLTARLAELDPDELAARARRRFWSGRPPLLDGQLGQLLALDDVTDETVLRRRAGTACSVETTSEAVIVTLGDRELRMPPALAAAMTQIAGTSRFTVGDLRGDLDGKGRAVLARRLVREGLLVVER